MQSEHRDALATVDMTRQMSCPAVSVASAEHLSVGDSDHSRARSPVLLDFGESVTHASAAAVWRNAYPQRVKGATAAFFDR